MDPVIWEITDGEFGLALVDKSAVGYQDSWQAPGGKTVDTVTVADYEAESESWRCQISAGALTAAQDTTTRDVPATFCGPARTVPTPKQTAFSLDLTFLQDANVARGLSRFLFEHDTKEAFVYCGFDNSDPPRLIGRCKLVSGNIGGAAGGTDNLTADVSLAMSRKPDVEFGDATESEIVTGGGAAPGPSPATGATAGSPGAFTPSGSTPPANAAGATSSGVVASPATAWTTGQYVQGSTAGAGGEMHWSGSAWATGRAT